MMTTTLALLGPLGVWEIALIAVVGLLIFGKRLPEVGRSLGKGIVEFKKGLQGIEDDVDAATGSGSSKTPPKLDRDTKMTDAHGQTTDESTHRPA